MASTRSRSRRRSHSAACTGTTSGSPLRMSDSESATCTTYSATCNSHCGLRSNQQLVLVAESDSAASQIVRGDFERHAIAGENADAKAPHLPRDRRMYVVSVPDANLEGRV